MLYGISLLAGLFNTAHLPSLAVALAQKFQAGIPAEESMVLILAALMVMDGLAFKLSAVPFHFWCPDVFQAAPIPVTTFLSVASKGAAVQRPLWASTSTKNPDYPDVMYVDRLIGPHTVNTMPPDTFEAFRDHGTVAETVEQGLDKAQETLAQLQQIGVDLDRVMDELLAEGVDKFIQPFDALMDSIKKKRAAVAA